jgi:penicillin-binding protein-related factor A (putative recombinase)
MATEANRGKKLEDLLKKEFMKLDAARSSFTFERIMDARSSLGKMSSPRAGDFCLYDNGRNILVEAKEVAHDYRLPAANFGLDQRARARKRIMAGTIYYVVVYHSTTKVYRVQELDFFGLLDKGSWDFRGTEELTLQQVIERLLK